MIFWCKQCGIPIFDNETCPLCDTQVTELSSGSICNPVYLQEKRLMTYILNRDVTKLNVWYIGSGTYIIEGVRTRLPFVDFYKKKMHLICAEDLRKDIVLDDEIPQHNKFVLANERYLSSKIYEAEAYVVHQVAECNLDLQHNYIPTISFSGGKDSTVISRLVRDALQKENIIHFFGNTTLEFPSTYEYVYEDFRKENPIPPMIPSETENDFFKLCNVFGPPSKFERWCCTIFKTSSINTEFQSLEGNSLTFLGIRRSESNERKNYKRTQTKSKIGSQINAMPIIDWTDYDVWLYLIAKEIKFNYAYRYGYKRVGCWCCPNNSDWAMMLTDIYYPELADKWSKTLYDFARKTKKNDIDDYVENGKWKTRRGSSGLISKNVVIQDTACNLSDTARNIIINKKIGREVIELLKPFGRLEIVEKDGTTYISIVEQYFDIASTEKRDEKKVCDIIINFGTTVVKVLPANGVDSSLLITRIKSQMRKYQFCIRCSACDSICPYGAINTMGDAKYSVDSTKCIQNLKECAKCINKFKYGCITCQVLSSKRKVIDDVEL